MPAVRRALLEGVASAVVVVGVVLATPAAARAAGGPAGVAVAIHQYQFHPDPITAEVGQSVTWTNMDSAAHDVTSSSGPEAFGSGSLATGQSYTVTFTQPGGYTYVCTVHPDMVGSLTVTPAPTTTTAAPSVAAPPSGAVPSTTVAAAPVAPAPAPFAALAPTSAAVPAVVAAPSFGHAARPLVLLLAVAVAVVAACLLLLGVGLRPGEDDA